MFAGGVSGESRGHQPAVPCQEIPIAAMGRTVVAEPSSSEGGIIQTARVRPQVGRFPVGEDCGGSHIQ